MRVPGLGELSNLVEAYALLVSLVGAALSTPRLARFWRTRHLRKVWGIKNGDRVVVVCSELDEPAQRQNVEEREFIYALKYGDVDAYFEVIATLLRLFPKIKLRALSSGEAEATPIDMGQHLILIGGPDYNAIAARILKRLITRLQYRSPYLPDKSREAPGEIVLYHVPEDREYFERTEEKDYGYFERLRNPNNPDKTITLIGGCHTIGVTGAVKAFSMAQSEHGEIPPMVLANAKTVAGSIGKKANFVVILPVERVGQTINTPVVQRDNIHTQ